MTEQTSIAIGKALYLELRKGGSTNQVIVIPEGLTTSGRYVPITTYRRRISESTPRKTWRLFSSIFRSELDPSGEKLLQLEPGHAIATVPDRMGFANGLFNQLIEAGYKVYKQPFAVEMTREDMDDVYNAKTPYKVIARVTRTRKALGFEDALWASE